MMRARSRPRLASPATRSRMSAPAGPTTTRSTSSRTIRACSAGNSASHSGSRGRLCNAPRLVRNRNFVADGPAADFFVDVALANLQRAPAIVAIARNAGANDEDLDRLVGADAHEVAILIER